MLVCENPEGVHGLDYIVLQLSGFLHIFKKHFPYFFNTFLNCVIEKTLIPSLIFTFPKFYSRNTMQKNLQNCHQWQRTKFELKNGWIRNIHTFSLFYAHFGQIQYFFKVLKTNFTNQYFFDTSNTVWEQWITVVPAVLSTSLGYLPQQVLEE